MEIFYSECELCNCSFMYDEINICESCGKLICRHCSTEVDDILICSNCEDLTMRYLQENNDVI